MVALIAVAISLGIGNFGAATAIGVAGTDRRTRQRVVAVFGLFEGVMPVIGIVLGHAVARSFGGAAQIVAGALLCAVGVYTVVSEVLNREVRTTSAVHSIGGIVTLGAVLSIDNLVAGFALGAYHVGPLVAALVLGTVSAILTLLGLELGSRLGGRAGEWSEVIGGIALVCVGATIAAGV